MAEDIVERRRMECLGRCDWLGDPKDDGEFVQIIYRSMDCQHHINLSLAEAALLVAELSRLRAKGTGEAVAMGDVEWSSVMEQARVALCHQLVEASDEALDLGHDRYSSLMAEAERALSLMHAALHSASPPVALPRSTTDPVCFDCGRDYGDEHGFPDLVIEQTAWNAISPDGDGNGLLCPSCLCKRLHVNGIECVGTFRSGPISAPPVALPEGWRDISTAPKDGTAVLIWNPSSYQGKGGVFVSLYFKTRDYGMQWICHPGYVRAEPTHWQPLPDAPRAMLSSSPQAKEGK